MKLKDIISNVGQYTLFGTADVVITAITADSRKVVPGTLFVAVKGFSSDGHDYIKSAIEKGATGIICEYIPEEYTLRGACPPPDECRGRGPQDTSSFKDDGCQACLASRRT